MLWKKTLTNFLPGIWLGFIHDLAPKGSVTPLFTSAIQSMNRLSCVNLTKHQALSLAGVLKCCHRQQSLNLYCDWDCPFHNAFLLPSSTQSVKSQFVSITSSWLKGGCNVNEWSRICISHAAQNSPSQRSQQKTHVIEDNVGNALKLTDKWKDFWKRILIT